MLDRKYQTEIDSIDKVDNILREIILKLLSKAKDKNLDLDTTAFLIYTANNLQDSRIELKETVVDFIRDIVPSSSNRTEALLNAMFEKDETKKEYDRMQRDIIEYLQDSEMNLESVPVERH